ncbi:MAG: chromosomal replication initiator protein DnaA, partial [Planctomycetota bacterium]
WFKHGTRIDVEDSHVRLTVPNPFVANWIETHYHGEIAAAIDSHLGKQRLLITIDPTLSSGLRKRQLDTQAEIVAKTADGRIRPRHPAPKMRLKYKLEDFVVGQSNKLAYSAAMAMAGGGKVPFNPLFIHGNCGVGKTHLLQGLCDTVSRRRREKGSVTWRYLTGEQFTNEFITALRQKRLDRFRARHRNLDLLAIDDVHFLSAKKATQEEFLHTFNALDTAGSRIVMVSDAHPRLVGELNAQLLSRFIAGMVVKIDPPDEQTRVKILRKRAKDMKLRVPKEVLEYIAAHIRGSVRELEGALVKLAALAALETGKITLAMATDALADHLARTDSALTLGDIEAVVATQFGITPADIHSSRRTRTVSTARMVAMFLARRHTQMSYPEIGRFMGKNHSSVVLAVQRMEQLIAAEGDLCWMSPVGPKSVPVRRLIEIISEQIV